MLTVWDKRVWIALELSGLDYQYIEVDPYKKPKELMDVNPRGLVPALRDGDWGCYESTVLMEYVDDISQKKLLPQNPKAKAESRLWADHISRNIVPNFYRYLQAQEADKQAEHGREFEKQVNILMEAADLEGPFFTGSQISFVDVMVGPWILRCPRVLQPYRGWVPPTKESRFGRFIAALESEESILKTTSGAELYLDSYERYAENRPNTSQVAKAINEGRGLP
ncbi:Glutathione S-transferase U1 [Orbilia ellipsospora]|uniref:Glutathione S-transferase U1 n=1 Tax=Orbilia ellipsospora TaxID=2528407 RepID=A0AAV9XDL1_9PEZI